MSKSGLILLSCKLRAGPDENDECPNGILAESYRKEQVL